MERITAENEAPIWRGSPREGGPADIDAWYNTLLSSSSPPTMRPRLYGADAGYCSRRNVLHANNSWVPFDTTPASNGYMTVGSALENMLADSLSRADRLIAQNMYLVKIDEIDIGGKIDLTCVDHDGELAIVEVKSCGKLPFKPKPNHQIQAQIYAAVSGFDKVWLTYISRSIQNSGFGPNVDIKSFRIPVDHDSLHLRLKIAAMSRLGIEAGLLPPVPAHFRKSTECAFCPFTHFCWDGEAPLPEMSQTEFDQFDMQASELATQWMKERPNRYRMTLRACLKQTQSPTMRAALAKQLGLQ